MKLVHHHFLIQGQDDLSGAPVGLYDYVITDSLVLLRAERAGLSLCLPWAMLSAPLRGLADPILDPRAHPHVKLTSGKIPATDLLYLQAAARTPAGQSFKETLFFLAIEPSGARRWWKPPQRRSWGMAEVAVRDEAYAQVVLELHTHPKGVTTFSSMDDLDEHGLRLYAILEDPDSATPLIRLRASVFGQRIEIPAEHVFGLPRGWRDGVALDAAEPELVTPATGTVDIPAVPSPFIGGVA
jgi:hypothetical protein